MSQRKSLVTTMAVFLLSGIVVFARAIARHKRLETDLKASEKKLHDITTALGEGICEVDREGRLTFMNPEAERLLGWTESELLGKNFHQVIHAGEETDKQCRVLRVTNLGGAYRTEDAVFARKDGGVLPVAFIATPVKSNGEVVSTVTAFEDISDHKRMEEALRRSEASLAEAQHVAHIGSWEWDVETNTMYWSDEIYRILGFEPQSFPASYKALLNFVHPDDKQFLKRVVNRSMLEKTPHRVDYRIILPDGTERIVHEQVEVIYDSDHRAVKMFGVIQDITERKKMEEALEEKRKTEREIYADAIGAITGDQFIVCDHEEIGLYRRGQSVMKHFITKPEEVHSVRESLGKFLESLGFDHNRIFNIDLVMTEALANSIKHAKGGTIEVRSDEVLQVEIADSGPGIDFSMLPRSVLMLGFSTKGTLGFGFNIMLEYTDRLFLTTGPTGTTIILEFVRQSQLAQPEVLTMAETRTPNEA